MSLFVVFPGTGEHFQKTANICNIFAFKVDDFSTLLLKNPRRIPHFYLNPLIQRGRKTKGQILVHVV